MLLKASSSQLKVKNVGDGFTEHNPRGVPSSANFYEVFFPKTLNSVCVGMLVSCEQNSIICSNFGEPTILS